MASKLVKGPFPLSHPPKYVDWTPPAVLLGKSISELKGKHSGGVAILFNGESLKRHDLSRLAIPVIGMNRTHKGWRGYEGPQPDYLCIVDKVWFDHPDWRASVRAHPCVINGSVHAEPIGYRVKRHATALFSFELEEGYAAFNPCTTGHLALQVAVYLGFRDLYCLGFDLGGLHFDGTSATRGFDRTIQTHEAQRPLLKKAGVNVWVVGSPESKAPFEHLPFEAMN